MAITVIDQPDTVSLTGSPIFFELQSDLAQPQIWIHTIVQVYADGAWVDQVEDKIAVDEDGLVVCKVQALLTKYISPRFSFPEHEASLMTYHPNMSVQFKLKYKESWKPVDDDIQEGSWTTHETSFYAIKGGMPPQMVAGLNTQQVTWWDDMVENKRFLTHQPIDKTTCPTSIEKLFWIMRSTATITLKVDWLATDASSGSYTTTLSAPAYNVVEACLSPALFESLLGKEIESYIVSISGLSEERTFTVDRGYKQRFDRLLYDNSLGAFDTLTATGMRTQTGENERESYKKQLPRYPELTDRTVAYHRAERNNKNESSLGFLNSQEWLEYTEEMDLSQNAYWLDGVVAKAINITTGESVTIDDEKDYFEFNVEWELAHKSIWFGTFKGDLQHVIPPYINKLSAFFNRVRGIKLVDLRFGYMGTLSGTDITFPEIAGNDLFDFSDAAFWDQTLIAATGWYDAENPRTCPLAFLQGWAWAEAATGTTHARLFHHDYSSKLKDLLPVLVYKTNLSDAEQQVVVDWLEWYRVIVSEGAIVMNSESVVITKN